MSPYRKYRLYVRWVDKALVCSLILLGLILLFCSTYKSNKESRNPSNDIVFSTDGSQLENEVTEPHFYGAINNEQPFEISAEYATKAINNVMFKNVVSRITLQNQAILNAKADHGNFDISKKYLTLMNNVMLAITHNDIEYTLSTKRMIINYPLQNIQILENGVLNSKFVTIKSNKFSIDLAKKELECTGEVTLDIMPIPIYER
ncbi:hypothetical protein MIDIC_430008 [Alphaproteobacteria bacterium]